MKGKRILIGVTGGIAAYKIAYLIRYFVRNAFEVKVIMTPAAVDFISPLTLGVLSRNRVLVNFSDDNDWNSHVEFGLWADYFLIAPATANTIAKMAHGIADNLLLTTYLSARCKVGVAPAMDMDMWESTIVQKNLNILRSRNIDVFDVGAGELASGLTGEGRMMEPEELFEKLNNTFFRQDLAGKKILITAGPTHEYIDPVRYIGNNSSGKMGIALARECQVRGAEVTLVAGPLSAQIPQPINRIKVVSAQQMADAVAHIANDMDVLIFAAAVADYTPVKTETSKIKKSGSVLQLQLKKTTDIAASAGNSKKPGQIIVGFALETDDEIENAIRKKEDKCFDMIVLNSLKDDGAGFGYDTNKVTIIYDKSNKIREFELKGKDQVAKDIIDLLIKFL
jgi:phosphopantothenoylcysteine decarboxylase/phosphopantothenate--cysteine ligase